MLNKIEFSDLYRFLTSIGLIFIASAFLIPWLFLGQDIVLLSETEYANSFQGSKSIIDSKISLYTFVLKCLPYISIVLFLFGVILAVIGLKKWKSKQDFIDETDLIKLDLLRASPKLNTEQIDTKAKSEITQEFNEDEPMEIEDSKAIAEIEERKSNLISMENLFYQKLEEYNIFTHDVQSNLRIDDKFNIDIVLTAHNKQRYLDKLIEIKYYQSKLSMDIAKKSFGELVRVQNHLYQKTKRRPIIILVLVYKNSVVENVDEVRRFKAGLKDYLDQFQAGIFKYFVLSEDEAKSFDVKQIVQ